MGFDQNLSRRIAEDGVLRRGVLSLSSEAGLPCKKVLQLVRFCRGGSDGVCTASSLDSFVVDLRKEGSARCAAAEDGSPAIGWLRTGRSNCTRCLLQETGTHSTGSSLSTASGSGKEDRSALASVSPFHAPGLTPHLGRNRT